MPELAEVETLRRQLSPLAGARVIEVVASHIRAVRRHDPADLNTLAGATVVAVERHGKWLHLCCDQATLSVHLRMSGRLLLARPGDLRLAHTHVVASLVTPHLGDRELRFVDPRAFGECVVTPPGAARPAARGRDALDDPPSAAEIAISLRATARSIKGVLLDQNGPVAGLGNIYADEVCAAARIEPGRPCNGLSADEVVALATVIPAVVAAAAAQRGTSLADKGWTDAYGVPGAHAAHLLVHARATCGRCAGPITKSKVAGRTTYHCLCCQARRTTC